MPNGREEPNEQQQPQESVEEKLLREIEGLKGRLDQYEGQQRQNVYNQIEQPTFVPKEYKTDEFIEEMKKTPLETLSNFVKQTVYVEAAQARSRIIGQQLDFLGKNDPEFREGSEKYIALRNKVNANPKYVSYPSGIIDAYDEIEAEKRNKVSNEEAKRIEEAKNKYKVPQGTGYQGQTTPTKKGYMEAIRQEGSWDVWDGGKK